MAQRFERSDDIACRQLGGQGRGFDIHRLLLRAARADDLDEACGLVAAGQDADRAFGRVFGRQEPVVDQVYMHRWRGQHLDIKAEIEPAAALIGALKHDLVSGVRQIVAQRIHHLQGGRAVARQTPCLTFNRPFIDLHGHARFLGPFADGQAVAGKRI